MSASFDFIWTDAAAFEPGSNNGSHWVRLRLSEKNGDAMTATMFVRPEAFTRFSRAAKAFNDALAEPVALANAAE